MPTRVDRPTEIAAAGTKPKIIRDAMNPAGSDEVAQISNRIKAVKQLLEWYEKCLPCLAYEQEGGQVPPKEELEKALKEAIAVVEAGGVAVVDARILGGYSPATAAAMARGKADRGS